MSMQNFYQTINEPSWDVALEFVEEDSTNNGIEGSILLMDFDAVYDKN